MKGFRFTRMFTSVSPFGSCAVKVPKHAAWRRKSREEAVTHRGRAPRGGQGVVTGGQQLPTPSGPRSGRRPQPDPATHPNSKPLGPLEAPDPVPLPPGWVTLGVLRGKSKLSGLTTAPLQGPPRPSRPRYHPLALTFPPGTPTAPPQLDLPNRPRRLFGPAAAQGCQARRPCWGTTTTTTTTGVAPPRLDALRGAGARKPGRFGARRAAADSRRHRGFTPRVGGDDSAPPGRPHDTHGGGSRLPDTVGCSHPPG